MANKSVENLRKLIALIEENPDLPVMAMVDSEVVADDNCGRWFGSIGCCRVEEYALYNDEYFDDKERFEEAYYDYMEDELCEMFDYNPRINEYTAQQGEYSKQQFEKNMKQMDKLNKHLDEIAEKYFTKAIFVNIDLPEAMV